MQQDYLKPLTGKVKTHDIAVFDIETTPELDDAYLLGFYDGKNYKVFEDRGHDRSNAFDPEDARGPISQFLSWLFIQGRGRRGLDFTKHWIYAHNGGNFDFLYLVRWLMVHPSEYSFSATPLQSSILCLEVTEKRAKRPRSWTFLDSYRLLNAPLDKLGKALTGEGKTEKFHLDGTAVDEKDSSDVERFYRELNRNPLRYEYLKQDCVLLYRCLAEFYVMVQNAGGEIGMTAPSSAMKSFRRMHMDRWVPINRHFPGCDCED